MRPLRFNRLAFLLATTAVVITPTAKAAPSVESRSEATTEGERKLLEPDRNRTFQPEMARFGSRTAPGAKGAQAATFNQLKEFGGSKEFSSKKFAASEFIPPSNRGVDKTFTPPGDVVKTPSFANEKSAFNTKSFDANGNPLGDKSFTTKSASDANREAAGQEAERMKEKYTPANPPKGGGVSTGHRLSVEEVRDILNKSK
ncbi:MAG: hypothetical protein WCO60_02215 [Verrucomicrobiota bacterium]